MKARSENTYTRRLYKLERLVENLVADRDAVMAVLKIYQENLGHMAREMVELRKESEARES